MELVPSDLFKVLEVALLVTAQTIITESYYCKRMAQTIYGMGVIVGPTLGPPLGGYLVDHFLGLHLHQYSSRYVHSFDFKLCKSPKYGEKLKSNQVDGNHSFGVLHWFIQFVLEHGQQDGFLTIN
jgi:DHA2 family multidrug resistance protein